MIKKLVVVSLFTSVIFARNIASNGLEYKKNCAVPHVLVEAVKLTENEKRYPYYIRTNDSDSLDKFTQIVDSFVHRKTKSPKLIDCLSKKNCTKISNQLIKNGITNLDLGLFQINYGFYPKTPHTYFDESTAYLTACKVIENKIKIAKKWDWNVLANYHSATPSLNRIYKKKLIDNYIRLLMMQRGFRS